MSLLYLTGFIAILIVTIFNQSVMVFCDIRASCRTIPGLTKDQLDLCYRAYDVTMVALDGLELAVKECQMQFKWNRWNCSSLSSKRRNPHASNLLKKGYRESAFAYAISSAGVAYSIAKACSQGRLISCGCDPNINRKSLKKYIIDSVNQQKRNPLMDSSIQQIFNGTTKSSKLTNRWKWGGCSHNMNFGIEFSELFLDSREKAGDIQSKINLHNNHAGRMAVANHMQMRCKCHGMSGSCQLKTCWKSAPDFRIIGKVLKQQFRRAILVDQSNMGNGSPLIMSKKKSNSMKIGRGGNRPSSDGNGGHKSWKYIEDIGAGDGGEVGRNAKGINRISRRMTQTRHITNTGKAKKLENSLFYFERSPNFCERDQSIDIHGTVGRRCNRTSTGTGSCSSMCCGRGYSMMKERIIERCNCKFRWCCVVECDDCLIENWISVCN